MKIVGVSVAAALLLSASLFAEEEVSLLDKVTVGGDARLWYSTDDSKNGNGDGGLLQQESSAGQAAISLSAEAKLTESTTAKAVYYGISTLGLQNNLVANVWEGGLNDTGWFGEAYISTKQGKTTGTVGRMELDTPLVFSEHWSIVPNTFEAAVVTNEDIPDTTLVGAYIGGFNGYGLTGIGGTFGVVINSTDIAATEIDGTATTDARSNSFRSFYGGAYAAGAVNNSWEPLTLQAWYYDMTRIGQAYWLQADLDLSGIAVGVQYMGQDLTDGKNNGALTNAGKGKSSAYAVKLGYGVEDKWSAFVAYSSVSKDAAYNTGGNFGGSTITNLYTEVFWNFGTVTTTGTQAMKVYGDYVIADDLDIGGQVVRTDTAVDNADNPIMIETSAWVNKSYDDLDVGLAYINSAEENGGASVGSQGAYDNMVQVYLTYNF